jgi:hypothetical protein
MKQQHAKPSCNPTARQCHVTDHNKTKSTPIYASIPINKKQNYVHSLPCQKSINPLLRTKPTAACQTPCLLAMHAACAGPHPRQNCVANHAAAAAGAVAATAASKARTGHLPELALL